MIDYTLLENKLKKQGVSKTHLTEALGLSTRTVAKIKKGEKLSKNTLLKISHYLNCTTDELYSIKSDNVLLQRLKDEKNAHVSGGIYHELQIRMTYNSNHIEGSRLTEDQTRCIFETRTIDTGDSVSVDDILETVNHFRAIDYCIDHAEEVLSEIMIKELHYILKHNTKDESLEWFNVGEYKARPNMVGGKETVKPEDVSKHIQQLLHDYKRIDSVVINDIIGFHAQFEMIHPFQDGNGRVGRLIAFKECLKHNIVPFMIDDDKKLYYYRGLSNYKSQKGWLQDTCLDGQDTMVSLMNTFDI